MYYQCVLSESITGWSNLDSPIQSCYFPKRIMLLKWHTHLWSMMNALCQINRNVRISTCLHFICDRLFYSLFPVKTSRNKVCLCFLKLKQEWQLFYVYNFSNRFCGAYSFLLCTYTMSNIKGNVDKEKLIRKVVKSKERKAKDIGKSPI